MPLIGVFDSGIGGLSVLTALWERLPQAPMMYVADSGFAPYGERDEAYVVERATRITDWLVSQGATLVVNACNTATAAAVQLMRERHPTVPMVGIEPAIKPAALLSTHGQVAVLATRGTLRSAKFKALLDKVRAQHPALHIEVLPCDGLAEAIERQSVVDDPERVRQVALAPLKAVSEQGADVVVLGCTHYPLVADWLQRWLFELSPETLTFVDPAPAVAAQAQRLWEASGGPAEGRGSLKLVTTGEAAALSAAVQRWMGLNLHAVKVTI
jgi:glutamate racemase